MTINIQYVHMSTSEAMNTYVTEKLNNLSEKFRGSTIYAYYFCISIMC